MKQGESMEKGNYGGGAYERLIRSMKKKNKEKARFVANRLNYGV
jgi:hypothetical protein